MSKYGIAFTWAIAGSLAACGGGEEARGGDYGGGLGPLTAGGTAAGTGTASGDDGNDGGASGGDDSALDDTGAGVTFDVGAPDDNGELPTGDDSGCQKIDFLFVIDNSDSMSNKQEQLIGAFPGFMDTIESQVATNADVHVLVADTDAWGKCYQGHCSGGECNDPIAGTYVCNDSNFDTCDKTRGAGVVQPAGKFASNKVCTPFGGNRYMITGEPDPGGTFECMATVGTAGDGSERPMDGIVAAISPELNAPGGCNDGFVRDDAILVITFISDDPWNEDSGSPDVWHAAVVDAKNGDEEAAVVLGLTPAWDGCRDGDGPPKGEHWKAFVELFGDHGLHGNVCGDANEYVSFFQQAVSIIDDTCTGFHPPG